MHARHCRCRSRWAFQQFLGIAASSAALVAGTQNREALGDSVT
jgi:hypothetical protein